MDPAKSAKGVEIMLELFGEIRIAQLKHKDLINQARKERMISQAKKAARRR